MHKRREGFTLIELLIVIVIIGILAAIAIPKFGATREKAYVKAMESDLRNLAAQQEIYYADHDYTYFEGELATGTFDADLQMAPSKGVTLTVTSADTKLGFHAAAVHDAAPGWACEIFIGDGETGTVGDNPAPGVVACAKEAAA
jgi:type IV pilus assembly protein PilA